MSLQTTKTLDPSPFKNMVMTIGNLPSSFVASMSYYEALAWLCNYLQTEVIPTVNNNSAATAELQAKFVELQSYVENYFENLDVQEEINNKLDQMADDGTLAELINSYLGIKYIFPKRVDESYSTWGDVSIIQFNNKNIMIDTGLEDRWSDIRLMMLTYNVEHVDMLIITHWHNDHYGNIENLIDNNYIDETTDVILCGDTTLWDEPAAAAALYKAMLEENGIEYTVATEGMTRTLTGGLTLKFNNVSNLDSYYSGQNYNACSMITTLSYKNHRSMFMADAMNTTLERLYKMGVCQKVDLYKVEHHAIGQNTYLPFIEMVRPNIGVVIVSPYNYSSGTISFSQTVSDIEKNGGIIYPTCSQKDYLTFMTYGENALCTSGEPRNISDAKLSKEIYVDISVEDDIFQDGSSTHPFNNLSQAIGSQPRGLNSLTIHVADGTYIPINENSRKNEINLSGNTAKFVEIIGNTDNPENVVIQALNIDDCAVSIKGITVKTDNSFYNGVRINNARATFDTVNIGDSSLTDYAGLVATRSEVFLTSVGISYQRNGIILNDGSYAMLRNVDFDHITENFVNANNSHYNTRGITKSNSTPVYFPYRNNQNSSVVIVNDATDSQINPSVPISNYESLDITFKNSSNQYGFIHIPLGGLANQIDLPISILSVSGSTRTENTIRIRISTAGVITFDRRKTITTNLTDGTITATEPEHNIYISKIVANYAQIA